MKNIKENEYYFAAMNTAAGFRGYFSEIFGESDQLYIIKGGPGTGKSRFMRLLGERAEENGYSAEYFLCSSDPTSLDGVIITDSAGKKTGIIDGTAPHAYEPTSAGIHEHILNFGEFWNSELLIPHKNETEKISLEKKRLYRSVYSYLTAVSALDGITKEIMRQTIDESKLNIAIQKLLKGVRYGDGYSEKLRIRSAVSCDGSVILGTYGKLAKKSYAVSDLMLTANEFMSRLKKELVSRKVAIQISYSPFTPDVPDAIYIPSESLAFYIGCSTESGCIEKNINMRRFVIPERLAPHKPKLREIAKVRRELLSQLYRDSASIRSLHAELEHIYGMAMDFSQKERFTEELSARLFKK